LAVLAFLFVAVLAVALFHRGGEGASETVESFPLPAGISGLVSADSEDARREALATIVAGPLSETEAEALLSFIRGDCPDDCAPNYWHAMVNDIVDHSILHDLLPGHLGRYLVDTARDPSEDPVLRDYALQFMAQWSTHSGPEISGQERDPALISEMLDTLRWATGQRSESFSATALVSLERISNAAPEVVDFAAHHGAAIALLAEDSHPLARVTALQVVADHGLANALPLIREIAEPESGQDTSLRLSAIAALGTLGTSDDRSLLQTIRNREPGRIDLAAAPALARLERKLKSR